MSGPKKLIGIAVLLLAGSALQAETVVARADRISAQSIRAVAPLRDVALQANSTLHGSVVDGQGMPLAYLEIWIAPDEGPVVKARTDASGRFVAPDLSPGIYRIDTPSGGEKFRIWDAKDAPRNVPTSALLVVCGKSA